MNNWQKSRNYRRIKGENGIITAFIITVDGVDVEVTEEVYLAYSQGDRRERYIEEAENRKILSLDSLLEDGVPLESIGGEVEKSAESAVLEEENDKEILAQTARLMSALSELELQERQLVQALFFNGISARAYAKQLGIRLNAVQHRRDKALEKLRQKIFS